MTSLWKGAQHTLGSLVFVGDLQKRIVITQEREEHLMECWASMRVGVPKIIITYIVDASTIESENVYTDTYFSISLFLI